MNAPVSYRITPSTPSIIGGDDALFIRLSATIDAGRSRRGYFVAGREATAEVRAASYRADSRRAKYRRRIQWAPR